MSDVDQHAEAHRLKEELNYGARRIAQELGITRHAATQLLKRPLVTGGADVGQRANVVGAIASMVSSAPGHLVTVTVVNHHTGPAGAGWTDSWTGTAESLANRIIERVSFTEAKAAPVRLTVELNGPVTEAQAEQVRAAVRAALGGAR